MFAMAGLPKQGYKSFLKICNLFEKGKLKDQCPLAKDLKAKPSVRAFYVKCLFGLDAADRVALLEKVMIEIG